MSKIFSSFFILLIFFCLFLVTPFLLLAQGQQASESAVLQPSETTFFEGTVVAVEETDFLQNLQVAISSGELAGETVLVSVGGMEGKVSESEISVGDRVLLGKVGETFYVHDFLRKKALFWLFMLFLGVAVLVAGRAGISSFVGLAMSFLVILKFILPRILVGCDPVGTVVLASFLLVPFNFYLSHGFNRKTTVAIGSTLVAILLGGLLAQGFTEFANLTGFASEATSFLKASGADIPDMRGLVLAGIIIGFFGILDDVTIAQASLVVQLKEAKPSATFGELFSRGLRVGKDHIASVINTLFLVYAGAALPLLLLFVYTEQPLGLILNTEPVAEEIVRTLVGSIALISAVPLTTFLACAFATEGSS
ncbi:MAG: YibE/F family protein [Patescibacteria group bacterium]